MLFGGLFVGAKLKRVFEQVVTVPLPIIGLGLTEITTWKVALTQFPATPEVAVTV